MCVVVWVNVWWCVVILVSWGYCCCCDRHEGRWESVRCVWMAHAFPELWALALVETDAQHVVIPLPCLSRYVWNQLQPFSNSEDMSIWSSPLVLVGPIYQKRFYQEDFHFFQEFFQAAQGATPKTMKTTSMCSPRPIHTAISDHHISLNAIIDKVRGRVRIHRTCI